MAVVGIDLGTTISVVARPIGNVVEVLPNEEGNLLTPSVAYVADGDLSQAVVGDAALNMVHSPQKNNVVRWVKRLIGTEARIKLRKFNSDIVEFTPTEISSVILRKLKTDAELVMDEPVQGAVITVPAWFGIKQCEEVMNAAKLAGLQVLQLLPEPQSAAIDYAMDQSMDFNDKTVFVYDLGGGTFDATLIRVRRESRNDLTQAIHFIEIAKEGSRELGGYDWDKQLVAYACDRFDEKHEADSRLESIEDLELEAERVKKLLSKLPSATFHINTNGLQDSIDITRPIFEEITHFLVEETRTKVRQTLQRGQMTWDQVDYVVLVGGSSHMPMIAQMIQEEVGEINRHKICRHKGVSFNVARGAAYVAGDFVQVERLALSNSPSSQQQTPVEPEAVGVHDEELVSNLEPAVALAETNAQPEKGIARMHPEEAKDFVQLSNIVVKRRLKDQDAVGVTGIKKGVTMNAIILPAGAYTDEEYSRIFPLADPNMTEVIVVINRGSSENLESVEQDKGRLILSGLPQNRPSGCLVEVSMKLDRNGMLSVRALDIETQQYCKTTIQLDPIS